MRYYDDQYKYQIFVFILRPILGHSRSQIDTMLRACYITFMTNFSKPLIICYVYSKPEYVLMGVSNLHCDFVNLPLGVHCDSV